MTDSEQLVAFLEAHWLGLLVGSILALVAFRFARPIVRRFAEWLIRSRDKGETDEAEQQELRKRQNPPAGRWARLRGIAGVWTFFGLVHVWLVEPPVAGFARRASFLLSLAGF